MSIKTNEFAALKNVKVKDGFWSKYEEIAKNVIIPYQWDAINDLVPDTEPSHAIKNFKIAAGEMEGEFRGFVFQDTDVAKWLEAVSYRLTIEPDEKLEKTADEVIDLIGRAQREDGYLDTYYLIKEKGKEFTNLLDCHEMYCAGHMAEAAVAYFEATGKRKLLDIVCRFLDLIAQRVGKEEGKIHGYSGHPEIELALVRVYKATGDKKYLDFCKYLIDERGCEPNFFQQELESRNFINMWGGKDKKADTVYCQAHKPLREQKEAVGHSVRAGYLYTGAAHLALELGDKELFNACETLWDNATKKQMYVTGGFGSQVHGEAFSFDYQLPNDLSYTETCAAISFVFFAQKMLMSDVDSKYSDVMERILYNGSISGMALDGKHFFYTNPLEVWDEQNKKVPAYRHNKVKRPGWFGCACCPPNLARMITSLGNYIYSTDENTVYAHLYIGSDAKLSVGESTVEIKQTSRMPWEGKSEFVLSGGEYTFAVRIPSWADKFEVKVNGEKVNCEVKKGYAYITKAWAQGDAVTVEMPMEVKLMEANPLVRADGGKVAISRGPVVYCIESADNGDRLSSIRLENEPMFRIEKDDELFEGSVSIFAKAVKKKAWETDDLYKAFTQSYEEITLKAIPYAFWGNRDDNREMAVWIRY
ncbi:MAG: glycoside hydrolase family 127 protein [Clostridia bacterium]|nr:glycoside hydrolase family 127 protein [Clostridia bacterium]